MLILLIIHGLSMGQLDCVMAYPQADVSLGHVYIEISKGFEFESKDSNCLHVLKGIYSRQDAGMTGDQYLVKGLKDLVFEQSQSDEWVFCQGALIFMIYVDEGILMDPGNSKIEEVMSDLSSKFEGHDKGDLSDYLGVKVRKPPDGSIVFVQAQLIDSTLEDLKLVNQCMSPDTPCKSDGKMNRDEGGDSEYPNFKEQNGVRNAASCLSHLVGPKASVCIWHQYHGFQICDSLACFAVRHTSDGSSEGVAGSRLQRGRQPVHHVHHVCRQQWSF
jgi:Reverse transcriptase (RNA-dependent DNA polymerase)